VDFYFAKSGLEHQKTPQNAFVFVCFGVFFDVEI
jgi:hypothetical protein